MFTISNPRKRVLFFLFITFLYSWSIWFFLLLFNIKGVTGNVLTTAGVLGPAIGAFFISKEGNNFKKTGVLIWLGLSLLIGLSFFLRAQRSAITDNNYDLEKLSADPLSIVIVAVNIVAASFLFLKFFRPGVFKPGQMRWWIAGFLFFPLLMLLVNLVGHLVGLSLSWKYAGLNIGTLLVSVLIAFPAVLFLHAGIEEIGWRGFLQRTLQQNNSPLVSALIVGVCWGLWHLPLHMMGFYAGGAAIGTLLTRLFVSICLSIILAGFYNRAGQSLLTVMILHTMSNLSTVIFPQNGLLWICLLLISTLCFLFWGKMWKRQYTPLPE